MGILFVFGLMELIIKFGRYILYGLKRFFRLYDIEYYYVLEYFIYIYFILLEYYDRESGNKKYLMNFWSYIEVKYY